VRLTFLGTSAGSPTLRRNVTSQAVQFDDGRIWMLDCGEGTQHQLMRSGLRASRVERILITHLHGDHWYGLPGLLAFLGINGREDEVELIGPRGLRELVDTILRLSVAGLGFRLIIREVHGPEDLGKRGAWSIHCAPLKHRVPSTGYALSEDPRPGRFHPERAEALGIPAGPDWKRLQQGGTVVLPDGRVATNADVCASPRRGRKLVLLGDTCESSRLIEFGQGCDVVVHECTYDASLGDKARDWGHSTSTMAGAFARELAARTLILTHFSARYDDRESASSISDLVREAQAECPDTAVFAAHDFAAFEINGADDGPCVPVRPESGAKRPEPPVNDPSAPVADARTRAPADLLTAPPDPMTPGPADPRTPPDA